LVISGSSSRPKVIVITPPSTCALEISIEIVFPVSFTVISSASVPPSGVNKLLTTVKVPLVVTSDVMTVESLPLDANSVASSEYETGLIIPPGDL